MEPVQDGAGSGGTGKKSHEIDARLTAFLHPVDDSEEDPSADLQGDWPDLEEAWKAYSMMEATDWHFLPYAGGLMDQPEMLILNIFRIARVAKWLKEQKNGR